MSNFPRGTRGFTLVEVMVVVAVIGMLCTIVYPAYARAREVSMMNSCINNLRLIANAKDTYAMDNNNKAPAMLDFYPTYIARNPICAAGGSYLVGALDVPVECTVENHTP
ncbi:MAG: prepilin-type N-terminal cleavage/methylation domain-containing protein [bacterium]